MDEGLEQIKNPEGTIPLGGRLSTDPHATSQAREQVLPGGNPCPEG